MNFNTYKENLGGHNNGQQHAFDAQNIIEYTWYDDMANTVGYFYDYYHDDEADVYTDLHPEQSKTKIPVEIKYILSPYRSLAKDEVDSRIMFKPSYKCNIPYYKELFEKPTQGIFPTGLYCDIKNQDGIWQRWLVINTADASNHDFPTWSILPCGHRFQWVADGKKYQMWGVERSQSSYTSGLWRDRVFETPDNITKAILPYNEITKTFFYNSRIIISTDLPEPLAWRVSKVEPFAHRGNILYTLKQDIYDAHHDYIERDEDGNIIGMWADYFKDNNLPSDDPIVPDPELNDDYAEISYAGVEPHIKVNGSYKKITLTYFNSGEILKDQTPGDWSYWIDDTDATDLVKVLETESSNTIKIKFLGDEEYLGKTLIIKNKRNSIVAELQLYIVAL